MAISKMLIVFGWIAIIFLSLYFYFDNAIAYLYGYKSDRFGTTFFHNQVWFVAHIIGATFSIFLGPVQFWKFIRKKYIRYHRIAGKLYILGSLVAGLSALRLSLINDCTGCRYPLFILSLLFILTTAMAWYAVKKRNILAHRQFMARSYTCALAFVFVRLYQVLPINFFFSAIEDPSVRRTVNEWFFSFVPLLLVEIWMAWIPSLQQHKSKKLLA